MLQTAAVWTGGGMSAPRLDRAAIAHRLEGAVEPWILTGLLDGYEAAALKGLAARSARGARRSRTPDDKDSPDER